MPKFLSDGIFDGSSTDLTVDGSFRSKGDLNYFGLDNISNQAEIVINTGNGGSPQIGFTENGDASWAIGVDDADNSFKIHGGASATIPTINGLTKPFFEIDTIGQIFQRPPTGAGSYTKLGLEVSTQEVALELGDDRTGSGFAYIDLIGDTTYADYGLRLVRWDGGANTTSHLRHRGTGYLEIETEDGGDILINPNSGNVGIFETNPTQKLHVSGNARVTGAYYDSNNSPGTSGQVLSSIGTGTDWIDQGDVIAGEADKAKSVILRVKNSTASPMTKGQVICEAVSASPPNGNLIEVALADNNGTNTMPALGILNEDLDAAGGANDEGDAIMFGKVSGIDTSAFDVGDEVFVSDTPGGLTITKPTGVKYIQKVGVVIRDDNTNGTIEVFGAGRVNDVPTPLYVDHANQRLGIGVISPSYVLDVVGEGNFSSYVNVNSATGIRTSSGWIHLSRYGDTNQNVAIGNNGTDVDLYVPNGRVGIGTTSPSDKLHIVGSNGSVRIDNSSSTKSFSFTVMDSNNRFRIYDNTAGSERLTITNGGNVGIGTTSPTNKLDVIGTLSATNIRVGSTASGEGIIRYNGGSGNGIGIVTGALNSSAIGLFVDHSANNRNVGIGTTSPSEKLEVVGNAILDASNANLKIKAGITGTKGDIQWTFNTDSTVYASAGIAYDNRTTDGFLIDSGYPITLDYASGYIRFLNNGSEKMRINTSGNVGIGTTSPSEKLDVVGNIKMTETAATIDTDKFVVLDSGVLKYRTGTQIVSDLPTDSRYVAVAGDTMTGDLILGNNQVDFKTNGSSVSPNFFGHRSAVDLDTRFFSSEGGWSYTTFDSSSSNNPGGVLHNANGLLSFNTHGGNYGHQIAMTTNTAKLYFRTRNNSSWQSWQQVFTDEYHPNADKWTTARTITLGGDLTGSVSLDGSANVTLSAQVVNNSHTHDDRYVELTGDTMTGNLFIGSGSSDNYVRSYFNDGSYTEMRGYGLQFSRAFSYIRPNADNTKTLYLGSNVAQWYALSIDATTTTFNTNGSENMRITSTGDVGIGTTSPSARLSVNGTTQLAGEVSLPSTGTATASVNYPSQTLRFTTSAWDTNNSVARDVHWNIRNEGSSTIYPDGTLAFYEESPSYNHWKLKLPGRGSGSTYIHPDAALFNGRVNIYESDTSNINISLHPGGDSYFNGGNVGIGTASPSQKLEVAGNIKITETAATTDTDKFVVLDSGVLKYRTGAQVISDLPTDSRYVAVTGDTMTGGLTMSNAQIQITDSGTQARMSINNNGTGDPQINFQLSASSKFTIGVDNSDSDKFKISGSSALGSNDRIVVDSSGNVGIGTTSPTAKLDVAGAIKGGGKVTYTKSYGSLDTTGQAVAGLTAGNNGNSAGFIFTCFGGDGYQKIVYSCKNAAGTWDCDKDIDEGTNSFDVVASANSTTITFTFKARSATQWYSPRVTVEAFGVSINTTYF